MPAMMTPGQKSLHQRLPYFVRRRLPPRWTTGKRAVVLVLLGSAGMVFLLLQLVLHVQVGGGGQRAEDPGPGRPAERVPGPGKPGKDALRPGKWLTGNLFGVRHDRLHHYAPDREQMFRCIQSGRKIPFSQVNDDYCDCESDGSDEPSTGACANSVFHCRSDGADGAKQWRPLPSSRINDGVCDCCDGSDEWLKRPMASVSRLTPEQQKKAGRFNAPCPNTCG